MKVKPNQEVLSYDNTPLKDSDGSVVTIKALIVNSINSVDKEEGGSGEDKMRAFELSVKMYSQEEVELNIEERNFILKKAEKVLVPIAYGRLKEVLDQ